MQGVDPIAWQNLLDEGNLHNNHTSKLVYADSLQVGQSYKIYSRAVDFTPSTFAGIFVLQKRENGYNYFQNSERTLMLSNRELGYAHGTVKVYKANEIIEGGKIIEFYNPFYIFNY